MSRFKPTHRVLVVATETDHSYNVISIDINSGFFKKDKVPSAQTKIRVKQGILAEVLPFSKTSKTLTNSEATNVVLDFNTKRAELGYDPVEFYRLEDANKES